MAVLSRPRLIAQERFDLEDLNTLLSALRTDSKLWTKQFLSGENYILKGFTVSGIGLSSATIEMDNATLIFGNNSNDFSWFVAEPSPTDITLSDADLDDGVRNYVEIELVTENNTPVTKAFWDPSANGGAGAEFNQQIDTVTDVRVQAVVLQGGFSGSPDRIPIAIIDTDVSGVIKVILDKRPLFFRLGTPSDPENKFTWTSQEEPGYSVTLTGVTGTFTAGETVTFSSGATATVRTGGTTAIVLELPSNDSMTTGDTLTGADSGATGTINTITESFTGADKDIDDFKEALQAIQSEIAALKGTDFWYSNTFTSLTGINSFFNSAVVPVTAGALITWDGTNLTITDSNGTPADADVIAKIRKFNSSQELGLTRQDGTGGSSTIAIADGEVLYVEVPSTGARDFSGSGSGSTNYKVAARGSYVANDTNYWIAYREGSKLFFRGVGELAAGESSEIGDNVPQTLLDNIGLVDETTAPSYSSDIRGTANQSIVARTGVLTDAMGDQQEDRSGFLRSNDVVTWTGTELQFTTDIVLQLVNTKDGTLTEHTILAANSPIALDDGETIYVAIDRTAASENVTPVNSGATPIPAQTQANKDIFVLFKRIDAAGVQVLHIPFHKQALDPGQSVRLGASGGGRDASEISYDNTDSGLTATDVQEAIDEVDSDLDSHKSATTSVHGITDTSDLATQSGQNTFSDVQSFSKPLDWTEQGSSPSTPSAGTVKVYAKDDGKLYKLASDGIEQQIGAGAGGQGGINLLDNGRFSDGTANWTASGNSTLTVDDSENIPVATWTPDADGDSLTADPAEIGTVLAGNAMEASIWYKHSESTKDAYTLQVLDNSLNVIDSVELPAVTKLTQAIVRWRGSSTSTDDVSLRILSSGPPSSAIELALARIGEQTGVGNGANIGESETVTVTGSWSTNTTYSAKRWRVGDRAFYDILVQLSGAPDSVALTVNLPTGDEIDTDKLAGPDTYRLGEVEAEIGAYGSTDQAVGKVFYSTTTAVAVWILDDNPSAAPELRALTHNDPATIASGDRVRLRFSAPIKNWSATNSVVQTSKNGFWISSYLENGTRVTGSAPTKLGEYQSFLRQSNANTYTEENGDPGTAPTFENGIALYKGSTAYSSADTNNKPTRYKIFVGHNKKVTINAWSSLGRTGVADITPMAVSGAYDAGFLHHYDSETGILTITAFRKQTGPASHTLGHDAEGDEITADGWFDVFVEEETQSVNVVLDSLVPTGSVLPFAGSEAPSGFLMCDGSTVSRSTYAKLFSVIGEAHGEGDGSTTFNLPDYRGRFLRGVDGGAGIDPDAETRTAMATGGATGDAVGSVQTDAIQTHTHDNRAGVHVGGGGNAAAGTTFGHGSTSTSAPESPARISTETRPVNAYVNYIIKT